MKFKEIINIIFRKEKYAMIIRFGGLGDYVLVQNFFKYIKNSAHYKNYKLIFLTYSYIKPMVSLFNQSDFNLVFGINLNKYYKSSFYRNVIKLIIKLFNIEEVIVPSDIDPITKTLLETINAKKNFVMKSEASNPLNLKHKPEIIDIPFYEFELYRYKEFFEKLLNEKLNIDKSSLSYGLDLSKKQVFISPSSMNEDRRWASENWAKICDYVKEKYDYNTVIIGSKSDRYIAEKIKQNVKSIDSITDLTGVMPIEFMPMLFSNLCSILIANDTGTVHIAAASSPPPRLPVSQAGQAFPGFIRTLTIRLIIYIQMNFMNILKLIQNTKYILCGKET